MKLIHFLFSFTPLFLFAQPSDTTHVFHSSVYGTDRRIDVVLPSGYNPEDTTTRYVTAYVFDGQWYPYLELVKATNDYYASIGEGISLILISIHSENRSLEFTPHWNHQKTYDGWQGNCGRADTLTKFLATEVIPWVENEYHTNGYRLGIGHSLGGTFVLNELFKDNSIFRGVIAISPNLIYDEHQVIDKGAHYFSNNTESHAFIYASAGDAPGMESSFRQGLLELDSIAKLMKSSHLDWTTSYLNGNNHMSTFPITFNDAYRKFSAHWIISEERLDEICGNSSTPVHETLLREYDQISEFAGFLVHPTVNDWNSFGYAAAYFGREEEAIELFNTGINRFPSDHNLHDSKAEILMQMNRYALAKNSFQEAMRVLNTVKNTLSEEDYNHYLKTYQSRFEGITDSLIAYKDCIGKAMQAMEQQNYKVAAKQFDKAFKYKIMRATHFDRKLAAQAYSQAGMTDKAFEQLHLLATKFQWRGKAAFVEDALLKPLHNDARWLKLMQQFEHNLQGNG